MVNRVAVLLIAAATAAVANARVLSPDEALSRALSSPSGTRMKMPRADMKLSLMRSIDGEPALYVFTGPDGNGFMMLSAESNTQATLGYDGTSPFNPDDLPPGLAWWIDHYIEEIGKVRQEAIIRPQEIVAREDRVNIPPRLTTAWSQDSPYNITCPKIDGVPALTGCVATAMAQVMKYHRTPAEYATGNTVFTSNGSLIGFDFSKVKFDWDNMLDTYKDGNYTPAQADAVARLMEACGMAVHMQYTPEGSGASTALVATALPKYFGYDGTVHAEFQAYYGAEEWESLLYTQIRDYGPVQFAGQSDFVGHSFVCDGYNTTGHFHFNWGWNGLCDGYFALNCLEPTAPGVEDVTSGYNLNNYIIANVRPATAGSQSTYPQIGLLGDFTTEVASTRAGQQIEIKAYYCNRGNCTIKGYRGVKFTPMNGGDPTFVTAGVLYNLDVGVYYTANYVKMPVLPDGEYLMTPVWCGEDDLWRPALQPISAIKAIKATYSSSGISLAPMAATSASVDGLTAMSEVYSGLEAKFVGQFVNNSTGEYRGAMRPMLCTSDGSSLTPVAAGTSIVADVMPGMPEDFVYVSTFTRQDGSSVAPGDYKLVFINENGMMASQPYELTVYDNPGKGSVEVIDFSLMSNADDITKLRMQSYIRCTDNIFQGRLDAYIFEDGHDLSVGHMQSTFTSIAKGQEANVKYSYDITPLKNRQRYSVLVRHNDQWISDPVVFTLSTTSVADLQAHRSVVSSSLFNLAGIPVTAPALAPGVYILRTVYSDGTVQSEKRVIR